jgi:hypothetical protein
MARRRRPPSQGWKTFLLNHADGITSIDLFVVPTISFRLLYGLLVLRHDRRRILWLGVTAHPTAEWIARQVTEACAWESAPQYLMRDRDRVYGEAFTRRIRAMGIRDRPTAPRWPWQNGCAERLIGSIRRECLDHVIVFGERHLRHVLRSRTRRKRDPSRLSGAFSRCRSSADWTTTMFGSNLRQMGYWGWASRLSGLVLVAALQADD